MQVKKNIISFLLVYCCVFHLSYGNEKKSENFIFKRISFAEGLTHSYATSIVEDKAGEIWVGTQEGLNRISSNEIIHYVYESSDSSSIINNFVEELVRDELDDIWVRCWDRLVLYNRKLNNFKTIKYNNKPITVYSICKIDGGLLFGGYDELYRYDYKTKVITLVSSDFIDKRVIGKLERYDSKRILLWGRDNAVYLFNIETNEIEQLMHDNAQLLLSGMFIDSRKNIWLIKDRNTLSCYRLIDNKLKLIDNYNSRNSNLGNARITYMLERNDKMWISTDGEGIQIYDYESKEFSKLDIVDNKMYSSLNATVYMYNDSQDNLWLGSVRAGVIRMNKASIYTYQLSEIHGTNGLSNQTVLSLFEDDDKNIWVGTDGGGVNRFNPITNKFTHFSSTLTKKIISISQAERKKILLSIYSESLSTFDYKNNSLSQFNVVSKEYSDKLLKNEIVSISVIDKNRMQLFGNMCHRYNLSTNSLEEYKGFTSSNRPSFIRNIKTEKDYSYAFCQNNIYQLSHLNNIVETIYESEAGISAATIDKSNNFWFCEMDGFLSRIDAKTKKYEQILKLSTQASAIVIDTKNRIWIGTRMGIFCYDIDAESLHLFGESDGVVLNDYISPAVLVSSHGDVYIGGIDGLVKIDADISLDKEKKTEVEFHSAMLNNKVVDTEGDSIPDIEIPWDFVSFKAKFTIKNRDVFEKILMMYTVDGLRESKIESYRNELILNSLAPGKYTITASFLDNDVRKLKAKTMFTLTVLQPWWKSAWIFPIYILLLLAVAISVYTYIFNKKQNKLKWQLKEGEKKLAEDKIRFLINISHELRTPLTLIYNPLKRLLSSTAASTSTGSNNGENETLKKIFLQVQNMFQLINMVLSVRKMEVGGGKLNIESKRLNEWIKDNVGEFEKEFEAKGIAVSLSLDPHIKDINLDTNKCKIIISNLLMNALKYSESESEICVKTEMCNDTVRISIIDQGIGIDAKEIDKIFQRFYQGDVNNKGYGIGLSYTKMLVEMHGGTINAYNNPDKGSTFYFEIPINIVVSDSTTVSAENLMRQVVGFVDENTTIADGIAVSTSDYCDYTLMVVDDEPEILELIESAYKPCFKKIILASNGREAIALAKELQPDIIVSDVVMPEVDGFQLCKTLKTDIEISHIPIILLTTRTDTQSTSLGYKMGADNYVTKPFDLDFLLTIIKNELILRENIKKIYQSKNLIVPEEGTFSSADEIFMQKLNDFIKENYANCDLDLEMIIVHMKMRKIKFQTKMKTLTNMTIKHYINIIRIKNAKKLFYSSDQSISEIGYSVGYSSPSYFSTVFKQILGVSPAVYRDSVMNAASTQNISIETVEEE